MVSADSLVAAPAADVYAYLADLERHWELVPGLVDVLVTDHDGAVLRLRGPLGLRRTVRTTVTRKRAPRELAGRARTAGGSVAAICWTLTPRGGRTHVRLEADVESARPLDRLLLALGGEAWLARAFARALARLEPRVAGRALAQAA